MRTIKSQKRITTKNNIQKSISNKQLKEAVNVHIDKMFEGRQQIITEKDLNNSYSPQEFKAVMKEEITQIFRKNQ